MTRVLPLPAAARTRTGPSVAVTASRWASVRSASRSLGSILDVSVEGERGLYSGRPPLLRSAEDRLGGMQGGETPPLPSGRDGGSGIGGQSLPVRFDQGGAVGAGFPRPGLPALTDTLQRGS